MNIIDHLSDIDAHVTPLEITVPKAQVVCTPFLCTTDAQANMWVQQAKAAGGCWAVKHTNTAIDQGPCLHLMDALAMSGDERALQNSVGNLLSIRTERI